MRDDHAPAVWAKSTYSSDEGECVEVATLAPSVRGVRDSKDPAGAVLAVPASQFAALLDGIKTGQF